MAQSGWSSISTIYSTTCAQILDFIVTVYWIRSVQIKSDDLVVFKPYHQHIFLIRDANGSHIRAEIT